MFLVCFAVKVWAAEAEETSDVVGRLIDTTDLGKNLQTLDDYYDQVNKKLNKRLGNQARDPFEKLLAPQSKSDPQIAKPRFIPRAKQAGSKEAKSFLNKGSSLRTSSSELPVMQFRGFIKSEQEKAGLLEIQGQGTFVVHEGDKVGLQQLGGDMVIRVVEINALNLIVEFGSLGEKVVVQ